MYGDEGYGFFLNLYKKNNEVMKDAKINHPTLQIPTGNVWQNLK
jgi:hypothetical protein